MLLGNGVYSHNTVFKNGDFQAVYAKMARKHYVIRPWLLLATSRKLHFFARGLHTSTAVLCLPLRQLGFLVKVFLRNTRTHWLMVSKVRTVIITCCILTALQKKAQTL